MEEIPVQEPTPPVIQTPPPIEPQPVKKPFFSKAIIAVFIIVVILIILPAGTYFFLNSNQKTACTTEAKICPDGSSVGRTGPKCEFQTCPKTKPSPSPIPNPTPTCKPRPACLDATPRCLIPETSDMCPKTNTTTATPDPASNVADATANWKTYTFYNTTITFRYPSDWILNENLQYSPQSVILNKQDSNGTGMYRIILEVGNIVLGGAGSSSSFQNISQFSINGQPAYILKDVNSSSRPSIYSLSSCGAPKKCLFTASGSKIDFYADYYTPGSQAVEPIPTNDPRTDIALKILSTFKFTQ